MSEIINFIWNRPDIFLLHLVAAIILFKIVNWLGYKSMSMGLGYDTVTSFQEQEDNAPAFNYVLRVLTPLIWLIIITSILYYLNLDDYVQNIYLVSIYYIIYRIIIIYLIGRILLTNWIKHSVYAISIILLTLILYNNILIQKKNVLPDFTTLSNELWIIILIFLYMVFNKIELKTTGTEKRRIRYIKHKYAKFSETYGQIINSIVKNEKLKAIVYSVIIIEDFNRYPIARKLEYIFFRLNKKKMRTLGIMQVRTDKYISNEDSVKLGTTKLLKLYEQLKDKRDYYSDEDLKDDLIRRYNPQRAYIGEVMAMSEYIEKLYYHNTADVLVQNPKSYSDVKKDMKKDEKKYS